MSKGNSYQFSGTKGEKIAQGIKPENQRKMVTSWAEAMVAHLSEKSKRKRDGFKTACVAFDEETGQLYFGRNAEINRDASNVQKNPILFGDSKKNGILPQKSLNNYPTSWNCAETDAINKALNAGAKLENIHIYTISTVKSSFGKDKPSCTNCRTTYKGRIKKNNTGWVE